MCTATATSAERSANPTPLPPSEGGAPERRGHQDATATGARGGSRGSYYQYMSVIWPRDGGGVPYLHLCDEEHGERVLSWAEVTAESVDAGRVREAANLLYTLAEQMDSK